MANYVALPSSGLSATWRHLDGSLASTADLRWENEGWTAEVQLVDDNAVVVFRLSAGWQIQQMLLFRDMAEPDLWLATDGRGHWGEMNGAHRSELDGCVDIDFANTPFTNSIITHRLPLEVGHTADLHVITVDVETLAVEKFARRYTRLSPFTWSYTCHVTGEQVEATVDEFGIVLDEQDRFTRAVN